MTLTEFLSTEAAVVIATAALYFFWPWERDKTEDEPAPMKHDGLTDRERDELNLVRNACIRLVYNARPKCPQKLQIISTGLADNIIWWIGELEPAHAQRVLNASSTRDEAWREHVLGERRIQGVPPVESIDTYRAIEARKRAVKMIAVPDIIARTDRAIREAFDD